LAAVFFEVQAGDADTFFLAGDFEFEPAPVASGNSYWEI